MIGTNYAVINRGSADPVYQTCDVVSARVDTCCWKIDRYPA